jgi:hypothetical protein
MIVHAAHNTLIIKAHAAGVEWLESLDLPPTRTIGCTSLLDGGFDKRRPYLTGDLTLGRHYIYTIPTPQPVGLPNIEFDCYLHFGAGWTRTPPDPSKYWVDEREPTMLREWPWLENFRDIGPVS